MEIQVINSKTSDLIDASISELITKEVPLRRDGWKFTWKALFKTEGSDFYKLTLNEEDKNVEGLLMLSLMNDEMLFMNNIEVAPWNLGSKGKYENVAGCLIAFACLKSFELGRNNYTGFLTFESKTELIELYAKKYGAIHAMGHKMFIEPKKGIQLIKQYLNVQL